MSDFVQVLVFSKTVNLVDVCSLALLGNFNFYLKVIFNHKYYHFGTYYF